VSPLPDTLTLEYRSANELWGKLLAEVYASMGGSFVVVSPGSRSTPLVIGLTAHRRLRCISVLDERSAGFLALGYAKATHRPAMVVTTSGTAAANLLPAVVEARESRVPLIVVTADRPPELRNCHSGQTIDQVKLFGDYPLLYQETVIPDDESAIVSCMRQTVVHAWQTASGRCKGAGGPVHLNVPLRDPLVPPNEGEMLRCDLRLADNRFQHATQTVARIGLPGHRTGKGMIIAGVAHWDEASVQALRRLARRTGWPVLIDALSGLREQWPTEEGIAAYDLALRNESWATRARPDWVFQFGALPTSKVLRQRLTEWQPLLYVCDPAGRNLNPQHLSGTIVPCFVDSLDVEAFPEPDETQAQELQMWYRVEMWCRAQLQQCLADNPGFEARWVNEIRSVQGSQVPLLIGNSMPVRDWEYFHPTGECGVRTFCNRGANGIDGTLSTAVGLAEASGQAILVSGDLGLLHDTNGFLHHSRMKGELLVVLIDNQGGGIFRHLPVRSVNPPFDEFFLTPQAVDWKALCGAYGVTFSELSTAGSWREKLRFTGTPGIRVLYWSTRSDEDASTRSNSFAKLAKALPSSLFVAHASGN
jgi:2-succinyl-5-enolpyruvyl-6-hydroxy-3-cyclohexene-1-carboxylate synthase